MKKIAAFTGAGISKASGIPTFQDMDGVREKLSIDYFMSNTEDFYRVLLEMKRNIDNASPNAAHMALTEYDIPVVTMNIDGLHKKAGSKQVVEIHGNFDYVFCTRCNKHFDFSYVNKSLHCDECSGLLKPNIVLYGENIPRYYDAIDLIGSADELLVVGTSFYTSTATMMVGAAQRAGIKVVTINKEAEYEVPRYLREQLGGK
ncbi:SIR2 family NAD-dependent protein deacylase [Lutispora thermophila]|uniref:protein acetyllysine N-acetyltransferase n=1 Tax=Lutispora thermophila DSM 19022 TaxID=1122184 RepID=A0A1M6EE54_9FIRM|nr:Sir2 family NAD-dependent protein deacetylase [Lutispora thermophila]SHI83600.1 NAD-dependent deacetylase [Lutispora thermophila DSM 19022]